MRETPVHITLSKRVLLSSIAVIAGSAVLFGVAQGKGDDPGEIADHVYQIYVDTMVQSNAALAGSPEVTEELGSELDTIKEAAVTKLVALGHEIAAMSASDRATVEGKLSSLVSSIHRNPETADVYADYQDIWKAYVKGDQEFFTKIETLNILTQYALFDLLRKQAPDEADRLGI